MHFLPVCLARLVLKNNRPFKKYCFFKLQINAILLIMNYQDFAPKTCVQTVVTIEQSVRSLSWCVTHSQQNIFCYSYTIGKRILFLYSIRHQQGNSTIRSQWNFNFKVCENFPLSNQHLSVFKITINSCFALITWQLHIFLDKNKVIFGRGLLEDAGKTVKGKGEKLP